MISWCSAVVNPYRQRPHEGHVQRPFGLLRVYVLLKTDVFPGEVVLGGFSWVILNVYNILVTLPNFEASFCKC